MTTSELAGQVLAPCGDHRANFLVFRTPGATSKINHFVNRSQWQESPPKWSRSQRKVELTTKKHDCRYPLWQRMFDSSLGKRRCEMF